MSTLFIRADANAQIGTGHVMRCLALAQAWQARGDVVFITACGQNLKQRLYDEGMGVVELHNATDWHTVMAYLTQQPGAWVVLDGYHFTPPDHHRIRQAGHPLLVVDDMAHLDYYEVDIILNQNINAHHLHYPCPSETRLLLGPHYTLLRNEFITWQNWQRDIPPVATKVLVTLGGSDPDNTTLKVIQALKQLDLSSLQSIVVVGASNPHYEQLQQAVQGTTIELQRNVRTMPDLMAWADIAISAAGSTVWEMAFMGLPTLLIVVAKNQRPTAELLSEQNLIQYLGLTAQIWPADIAHQLQVLLSDEAQRRYMSQQGQKLIDGQGSTRILSIVQQFRG